MSTINHLFKAGNSLDLAGGYIRAANGSIINLDLDQAEADLTNAISFLQEARHRVKLENAERSARGGR